MITILTAFALSTMAPAGRPDFSHANVAVVAVSDFKFMPSTIHLRAGQPVILRLSNNAAEAHDFAAPAFFARAAIRPSDAAMIRNGEIEMEARQTRAVGLVPVAGRYSLQCNKPGHAAMGMTGTIIVD